MQGGLPSSTVPAFIPGLGVSISANTASAAACIPSLPATSPVPTPPEPLAEPKPKTSSFSRDPQLLQAMCATAAQLRTNALPGTDIVVTFDQVLAGAAGTREQQAALAMLQDATVNTRQASAGRKTR